MTEFAKDISELMSRFDNARKKWIDFYGTEDGFEEFLILEIMEEGKKRKNSSEAGS